MGSAHTGQPMSGTAGGNVPPWFCTDEELALARRWALASGLATLLVWWFREQAVELALVLFLYQLFLAVRSYAVTGRRRFLAVPALLLMGLLPKFVPYQPVMVSFTAIALLIWPVLGLGALATLVNPARLGRRRYAIGGAMAFVALYAKSVFLLSPDSFRTLDAADVSGCYRVLRGVSFPLMDQWLPGVIKLDTVRWTEADTVTASRTAVYVARDHKVTPSLRGLFGHWRPEGGGLVFIGWTYRRLGGVRGQFRRDDDDLVGRLVQYQDSHRPLPLPVLSVRFVRTACPVGVSGDLPEPTLKADGAAAHPMADAVRTSGRR